MGMAKPEPNPTHIPGLSHNTDKADIPHFTPDWQGAETSRTTSLVSDRQTGKSSSTFTGK